MAKRDFNSTQYAKFFSSKENRNFLQKLVNREGVLRTNYGWYLSQGSKASIPTPVSSDGTAVFQVACRSIEAAPLMDMRAPLADSLQQDTKGAEFYTASIPHFIGKGTVESAMERERKEQEYADFGDEFIFVDAYVDSVQEKVDSVDSTLNFLTARLMSTGKIDYRGIGQGIQAALHKALIPVTNFTNAGVDTGSKPWTDPDCDILAQMAQIEKKYREQWGTDAPFIWQMPYDMFYNVFLKNKSVIEFVKQYRTLNYLATEENIPTTESMFRQAAVDLTSHGISPIHVVAERSRNVTADGATMINGWEQSTAVFRPAGDATTIQWFTPSDQKMFEKYGAKTIDMTFAKTNNGLATLINTTLDNGKFKEWHTDIVMSAMPSLNEFLYHVIVNTSKGV